MKQRGGQNVRASGTGAIVGSLALKGAAGAAIVCALAHTALFGLGGRALLPMTVPMLALALTCGACGASLSTRSDRRRAGWALGAGGSAMLLLHLALEHLGSSLMGHAAGSMERHGDSASSSDQHAATHLVMHLGVTLAAVQVLFVLVYLGMALVEQASSSRTTPRGVLSAPLRTVASQLVRRP